MPDKKDQNEEKGEAGRQQSDQERDDILNQLSETKGQKSPERKQPRKEKKPEKAARESSMDSEESEDLEALIDKKITEQPQSQESIGPVEEMNAMRRIVGIFTSPEKVFQYLSHKPEFWIPVIITIIAGVASSFLVYDIAITDTIANYEQMDIPDEQKDMIIDTIEDRRTGAWRYASIFLFPIIWIFVVFALVTLAYWIIGNFILGGKAKFKQIFSAFAYSYLILAIVGTIVKVPLMLSNQTIKVQTSLAAFMSDDASKTALYRFFDAFDIFTIWLLVVFAIGYAVIYRFSQVKAFMGVFVSWLLYVLVFSVALGSFFAKFTGQ